jgi:hypothetical protein
MKGGNHMDDSATGRTARAGRRGDRRHGAGSSVLTPPTGIPAIPDHVFPDLDVAVPAPRSVPVTPTEPPAQLPIVDQCTCGHPKSAHEHYRRGTDCGACGPAACAEYEPVEKRGFWRSLFG